MVRDFFFAKCYNGNAKIGYHFESEIFWLGAIDEDERNARVDEIKKRYNIRKDLDFEPEYLRWVVNNVPLHPRQSNFYAQRIRSLRNY